MLKAPKLPADKLGESMDAVPFRGRPCAALIAAVAAALVLMAAAAAPVMAQCVCDDGTCDSVGRSYFAFGDTVDEDCHFTADLVRPAGNSGFGLVIKAHGITIDGRGYCLNGDAPDLALPGRSGVYADKYYGAYDVTIKDLEIKNFWQGIYLRGNGAADPIGGVVVDNCRIHDNGVLGDDRKYEGIWLDNAEDCTVRYCTIYNNNQGSGIANGEGDSNTFIHNEIYNNYKHGIKAWWDSWYLTSSYNVVHDNGFGGINHRTGSNYGTLEYNVCTDNTGPGLSAGGTENVIRGNISNNSINYGLDPETGEVREDGMGIDCTPDVGGGIVTLEDNVACGNQAYDIYLGDDMTGKGEHNTCNTAYNYSDPGTIGCAEACEGDLPIAKFYADTTQVCSNGAVYFYDLSLCDSSYSLTWEWDFGDGTPIVTAQNPVHTFTQSGIYSVTLTVTMTDPAGSSDSVTRQDYITVCPYEGDLDFDSDVDGTDYYTFYTDCVIGAQPAWCDINGDGNIDAGDMENLGLMDCLSCP